MYEVLPNITYTYRVKYKIIKSYDCIRINSCDDFVMQCLLQSSDKYFDTATGLWDFGGLSTHQAYQEFDLHLSR